MSADVLLNLLNELWKRDKMRGLPSILSLFRNEFDKFNNTGARTLDSVYHMTFNYLKIAFWRENVKSLPSFARRYNRRHYVTLLNLLYDSKTRRHVLKGWSKMSAHVLLNLLNKFGGKGM